MHRVETANYTYSIHLCGKSSQPCLGSFQLDPDSAACQHSKQIGSSWV